MSDELADSPVFPSESTTLAMVLSRTGEPAPEGALLRAIRKHFPEAETAPESTDARVALFRVDDLTVASMWVEAPAPIAVDDPCVRLAWHWPGVWKEIEKHAAHVVVSVAGGADAGKRALSVSFISETHLLSC